MSATRAKRTTTGIMPDIMRDIVRAYAELRLRIINAHSSSIDMRATHLTSKQIDKRLLLHEKSARVKAMMRRF
jgi:hypothetical protein